MTGADPRVRRTRRVGTRVPTQAEQLTDTAGDTLHANILKGIALVCARTVVGRPHRLELGRYNRPGSATKFGNLKGRTTNWDGEGRRPGKFSDTYCDSASTSATSFLDTGRRGEARRGEARRDETRRGVAPTLSGGLSRSYGFRAQKDIAVSSGFHASVSVLQMDAFSSFINPHRVHSEIKSSTLGAC